MATLDHNRRLGRDTRKSTLKWSRPLARLKSIRFHFWGLRARWPLPRKVRVEALEGSFDRLKELCMRILRWLMAAFIAVVALQAQSQEPTAPRDDSQNRPGLADDSVSTEAIAAFIVVLKAVRAEPNSSHDAGSTDPVSAANEFECASDEPPFAELLEAIPAQRFDEIAKANGFRDAAHWQRVGTKVVTLRAITKMMEVTDLTSIDIDLMMHEAEQVDDALIVGE